MGRGCAGALLIFVTLAGCDSSTSPPPAPPPVVKPTPPPPPAKPDLNPSAGVRAALSVSIDGDTIEIVVDDATVKVSVEDDMVRVTMGDYVNEFSCAQADVRRRIAESRRLGIRYAGIEAPELWVRTADGWVESPEPSGREAAARNAELLGSKPLLILPTNSTTYGRIVSSVYVDEDGPRDVVEAMLRDGWGWLDRRDIPTGAQDRYLTAQVEAIEARRGIWSGAVAEGGAVRASRNNVFHAPECKDGPRSYKDYPNPLAAFRDGHRPHKGSSDHPGCWKPK